MLADIRDLGGMRAQRFQRNDPAFGDRRLGSYERLRVLAALTQLYTIDLSAECGTSNRGCSVGIGPRILSTHRVMMV